VPTFPFRFDPLRRSLYSPDDLFASFDPDHPESYGRMHDFAIYEEFMRGGGRTPGDYWTALAQAMHDSSIRAAVAEFLIGKATVGIMGGHELERNDPAYAAVARLARELARESFTVVSGGGPGAMEATHLGALLAHAEDGALDVALAELGKAPRLQKTSEIVDSKTFAVDHALVEATGAWVAPAYRIWQRHRAGGRASLGVPTWFYGSEPTTPFATNIAKYFQNSVREDGTLSICTHGIIFIAGGGGTAQEIFQDGCLNFYAEQPAPMIFYDADGRDFWTNEVPAVAALRALLGIQKRDACVFVTGNAAEIVACVKAFQPKHDAAEKLAEYRKR
jgi:predicted Rossmann-fold nucleotide-binding protein